MKKCYGSNLRHDASEADAVRKMQYKFDGSDWIGLIQLNNIQVNQTFVNITVELFLLMPLPSVNVLYYAIKQNFTINFHPLSNYCLIKGRLDLLEGQQQAS